MNHYQYVNTSKRQQLNGKSAAVIRYDEGSDAPKVVAQGRGQLANHIINLAKEHQVDMQEDSTLLANLLEVDLGDQIPPQLYSVSPRY